MSYRRDKNRRGFHRPPADKFQNQPSSHQTNPNYDDGSKEKSLDEAWGSEYLKEGYFDSDGCLREELVKRRNIEPLIKAMALGKPKPLTNNQLRRFFQHCRYVEGNLLANQSTWECEKNKFDFIDVAAADAFGKKDKKIPKIFHDFIQRNVETVKTKEDFLDGFMKHFEAVVGFAAQHLNEKERN